jgi:hypothetical protein
VCRFCKFCLTDFINEVEEIYNGRPSSDILDVRSGLDAVRQPLPAPIDQTAKADNRRDERDKIPHKRIRRIAMSALQSQTHTYDSDLAGWMSQQIEYLKAGQIDKIDMPNFLEEIEGVVKTEKRSMKSYFKVLITHMLKWKYQPSQRSGSWLSSIDTSREEIQDILKDSPSLKNYLKEAFDDAWESGRKKALQETGLRNIDMPRVCPWTVEMILTEALDTNTINSKKLG